MIDFGPEFNALRNEQKVEVLKGVLRELESMPLTGWHLAFYMLMLREMAQYGSKVSVLKELELGEMLPRADIVVLLMDQVIEFDKAIFHIFRKANIIEYKNPHDKLDEAVLDKVGAYAGLYASAGKEDDITISIFRAVKNPRLFKRLREAGQLQNGGAPGIYHLHGWSRFPFQIVITGELEGDEYAAYRALTDKANERDVKILFNEVRQETDESLREYGRTLFRVVMEQNPGFLVLLKGDSIMKDVLMEALQDRIDEKMNLMTVEHIKNVMKSLDLSPDKAMDVLLIPQEMRPVYTQMVQAM